MIPANLACALTIAAIYRGEYAAFVASFGQLKPASRMLVGHSGNGEDAPD